MEDGTVIHVRRTRVKTALHTVEITVAPYLAGMVNHAMMDETVKITDYNAHGLLWITDSGRGQRCTERRG